MTRFFPLALAVAVLAAGCQTDDAPSDSLLVEVEDASDLVDEIIGEGNEATVVNFWATWCGPCRIEFPDLIAYDAEMEGQGVEVRFVSVDEPDMMPQVRAFLDEQGVTERSFVAPEAPMLAAQFDPRFGVSLPLTLVMDSEGIVRGAHAGLITKTALTDLVAGVRDGSIDITTQL
ncbi:MAG: TlpA disulfide reductase family protein [Bacteroidota bacterium]